MLRIKVQYDAFSRTFKLVDQEFKTLLEGDALYDLNVTLVFEDSEVVELITSESATIAAVSAMSPTLSPACMMLWRANISASPARRSRWMLMKEIPASVNNGCSSSSSIERLRSLG